MIEQRVAILEAEIAKMKKVLWTVATVAFACAVALGVEL